VIFDIGAMSVRSDPSKESGMVFKRCSAKMDELKTEGAVSVIVSIEAPYFKPCGN